MRTALFSLLIFFFSVSCETVPVSIDNVPGVSLVLAEYRVNQVSDIVYNLSFQIPKIKEEPIPSELNLSLKIMDLSQPLYLDFKEDSKKINSIYINNKAVEIEHKNEHIILDQKHLQLGENNIYIKFIAGNLSLNRNDNYLYTLLVPDRARTLFPCLDQPNIKAVYKLSVRVSKDWTVLSGSHIETIENDGVNTTYNFRESDLMSTYLFSFVAGEFQKAASKETERPMNMIYREDNPEKTAVSIPEIFKIHQSGVSYLEKYTDVNYPFQKLDFATIPGFQYGGMEHTSAIQYRESTLFLDKNATQLQELSRAKLIAHETAHMWFGNLVTMNWFNDVWMKEVFANFMADKIVNPLFSNINHDLQFLTAHYPRAFSVDRTKGSNAIRQELNNLENAGSLYGSIIYNKAPIMMRQLELLLGEESFRTGIQTYIKTYANKNADWNDLVLILNKKTKLDLEQWSDVWVNSAGRPLFIDQIVYDQNQQIKSYKLIQKAEDGSNKIWPQAFDVSFLYEDHIETLSVLSNSKTTPLSQAVGLKKPKAIIYNSNAYGYGVFPAINNSISIGIELKNEVSRAQVYINEYENAILDKSTVLKTFESFLNGIEHESNELILRLLTNQTTSLFWYHLSSYQRENYQTKFEEILLNRLNLNASKNIKKTCFNAYTSIAYSKDGLATLYQLWNKDILYKNLLLNQDDYTRLAQNLSLFNHPKAIEILDQAEKKVTNQDKRERFEFLKPALSNDVKVRNVYFESFKNAHMREKESWTQTAAAYIHHPIRQKEGVKNIDLSLELLEEIQQTGDIFFPKRWLDSTIGKYTSKEAYNLVLKYLKTHPDLDQNLKNKLLQATDKLYRNHQVN